MSMGLIEIEGMEFYAYHGHYPVEKKVGNRFLVNLKIKADCEKAGKTDKLEDALDYQKAYQLVKVEMAITSDLLEHVATRILDRLYLELPDIQHALVKVSKMNPPMGGQIEKVSVTLER
jgi:dihydroneopterin aldolase